MQKAFKNKIATSLTIILWFVLVVLMLWSIIAIIWWIFGSFIFKEIFVPEIVKFSIYSLILVLLWITLMFLWFMRVQGKKIQDEGTRYDDMELNIESRDRLSWSEISIIGTADSKGELIIDENERKKIENLAPTQLLSYSMVLSNRGKHIRAISLLRMIINKEDAPVIIKYGAYHYMQKLLKVH